MWYLTLQKKISFLINNKNNRTRVLEEGWQATQFS